MIQFCQQSWLLVFLSAFCNGIGTTLLKQSRLVTNNSNFLESIFSFWFISALVVYSTGMLLGTKALEKLPVSVLTPVSQGMSFLIIAFLSYWIFDERLTLNQIMATGFIFTGIILMTR
ncbi:MAG: EamA family transporter [Xenococcaceae cyanobacterium MO_188.B32]|nr:EamA family transporter [Xenococcaceae cyanobacterium MO_188.B32]